MSVSPYSKTERDEMEKRIALKMDRGMSRRLAALRLLEERPNWFKQTPEGECLLDAASLKPNWVNTYQWGSR